MAYRIVPSLWFRPATLALAPRRERIEDAVADMGTGVVIAEDGHIAAFHESHLRTIEYEETKA